MKRMLLIIFTIATVLSGCGETNNPPKPTLKNTTWAYESGNLGYLLEFVSDRDVNYFTCYYGIEDQSTKESFTYTFDGKTVKFSDNKCGYFIYKSATVDRWMMTVVAYHTLINDDCEYRFSKLQ
ncbi:MAG: hypothetical protein MJZ98_02580 [Paludibacteraceae bacterium]|nr:hypothetical protein [Paludibacteraceae bacterium]